MRTCPTVKVKSDNEQGFVVINKDDFDEEIYTIHEETPVEETPVEETPVEETPVEETPVEETPSKPSRPSRGRRG